MTAFDDASKVEASGMPDMIRVLGKLRSLSRFVMVGNGTELSMALQKSYGDVVYEDAKGGLYGIEIKVEESERFGNCFIETWSNKSRNTAGWLHTSKAKYLFYYFLRERMLLITTFEALRDAHRKGCLDEYPEKCQQKHKQLNDTWGRCVPITDLITRGNARLYTVQSDGSLQIRQPARMSAVA